MDAQSFAYILRFEISHKFCEASTASREPNEFGGAPSTKPARKFFRMLAAAARGSARRQAHRAHVLSLPAPRRFPPPWSLEGGALTGLICYSLFGTVPHPSNFLYGRSPRCRTRSKLRSEGVGRKP